MTEKLAEKLDLDHLKQWIGRTTEASDIVTAQLVKGLRATLFQEIGEPKPGDAAPFTVHWCLAQPVVSDVATGPRRPSHPRRLPAAGAAAAPDVGRRPKLESVDALRVGDEVKKISKIVDVQLTDRPALPLRHPPDHGFSTPRGEAVFERQDVVYYTTIRRRRATKRRHHGCNLGATAATSEELRPIPCCCFAIRHGSLQRPHPLYMIARMSQGRRLSGPDRARAIAASLLRPNMRSLREHRKNLHTSWRQPAVRRRQIRSMPKKASKNRLELWTANSAETNREGGMAGDPRESCLASSSPEARTSRKHNAAPPVFCRMRSSMQKRVA